MKCLALHGLDAATSYRCDGHVIAACAANAGLKEPFNSFKHQCMGGNIAAKHHHSVGHEKQVEERNVRNVVVMHLALMHFH